MAGNEWAVKTRLCNACKSCKAAEMKSVLNTLKESGAVVADGNGEGMCEKHSRTSPIGNSCIASTSGTKGKVFELDTF